MKNNLQKEKQGFVVSKDKSKLSTVLNVVAVVLMLTQWIAGLNIITLVNLVFLCVVSLILFIGIVFGKRLNLRILFAYFIPLFAIASFYVIAGADAGWGALSSGKEGFVNTANALWQGEGNFFTRLIGNILIILPCLAMAVLLGTIAYKFVQKKGVRCIASFLSAGLMLTSVALVFMTNLRAKPQAFDLSQGEEEYLKALDDYYKNNPSTSERPNVLVILMDDMGYGDTSLNGNTVFSTPTFDYIGEEGLNFENFYASYSVCSPSRFALMTGRYPYRGYADNVLYPTVNTTLPVGTTRVFNSFEMGANCDGMLGDEITIAEVFKNAGYATGAFGKWHLGDYGEYLPTNQGFDYFYGSHYVNDMTPFYYVEESDGQYEIVNDGTSIDQKNLTSYCHESISGWIDAVVSGKQTASGDKYSENTPFFAYYATPWPHAPLYGGKLAEKPEYAYNEDTHQWELTGNTVLVGQGSTGVGIYADVITEFDYYLSELFYNMQQSGMLDNTVIMFTSDNGPALQGSTDDLRGGKYTAYEGGQKVPFYMRWGNNEYMSGGSKVEAQATLVDIFPTLIELCGINGQIDAKIYENMMPFDREIDGVSMNSLYIPDADGNLASYIHGIDRPILYMKAENIKSVSYAMTKEYALDKIVGQNIQVISNTGKSETYVMTEDMANNYDFIRDNDILVWKYFRSMQNDNPAFFNLTRKNWLICLSDDESESYQRADIFPAIAAELKAVTLEWQSKLAKNRRGVNTAYYYGGEVDYELYKNTLAKENSDR